MVSEPVKVVRAQNGVWPEPSPAVESKACIQWPSDRVTVRHNRHVCYKVGLPTVTMPAMRTTIDALKQAGVREWVNIMVGGAPVTPQFAEGIRADGYSDTGGAAVALARTLIGAG